LRFSYDPEAGAGYIELAEGTAVETVPCENGVNLDFNKSGELVGVEIYNADTIPSAAFTNKQNGGKQE